jgi:FkbM family methyltransferase
LWWKGWGGYEALVTSLFAACSREAKCIVDVGANSGLFSLTAAACSRTAIIHAFEPFPPCQALLERNLSLNSFESRVKIRPEALSEKPGQLDLYVPLEDKAGYDETSCSLNSSFRPEHSQVLPVPVITLDDYVAEQKIDRIDLLKIDVETHEPQVLRGAAKVLDQHRPMIFIEVLDVADTSALTEIANQHNYVPIVLARDHLEVCPVVAYRKGHYNQVFCPSEKLADLKALARRLGYLMLDI